MPEHRNPGSPPALVMIYAISPLTTSPTIIIIKSLGCRWFFMPLLDVVTQYQVSLIVKRRHDSLFGLHIISHNYWCILYFATSSCWCWHTAREIYLIKYSYTCEPSHVDEARRQLFVLGNRTMGKPPPPPPPIPTKISLLQHVRQYVFAGGYVWAQSLLQAPNLFGPGLYGWATTVTETGASWQLL